MISTSDERPIFLKGQILGQWCKREGIKQAVPVSMSTDICVKVCFFRIFCLVLFIKIIIQ